MNPEPVTNTSGKAVCVLKSSFSCSDIHDGIAKALAAMDRSPSPPPPASSARPLSDSPADAPSTDAAALALRKVAAPLSFSHTIN